MKEEAIVDARLFGRDRQSRTRNGLAIEAFVRAEKYLDAAVNVAIVMEQLSGR